jgi:hypothetical protein
MSQSMFESPSRLAGSLLEPQGTIKVNAADSAVATGSASNVKPLAN